MSSSVGDSRYSVTAKAVAAADLAGVSGRKSTNAHLALKLNTASSQIAPSRTLGVWLTQFGVLADAWEAGLITEAHIRALKCVGNGRARQQLQRDQQMFIDMAQTLEFNDWETALQYWLMHADPDGALDPEREKTYGLTGRTLKNGDVDVKGTPRPHRGPRVSHHARPRSREGPRQRHRTRPRPRRTQTPHQHRPPPLTSRGFRRPNGTYPVPLVNIVLSEKVAEAVLDDISRDDGQDTALDAMAWDDPDGRCKSTRGTPLHPRRTWPALLAGQLRRQILNAKGRTTDIGQDTRLFPAHMKNALLVEARGHCPNPGCTAPYPWLQASEKCEAFLDATRRVADHIQAHSKGGATSMANGQILCQPDNHTKGDR